MANILTSIRVICGLLILRFPAFSGWYYALYLIGAFTDAVDGAVARRLGKATRFGAKYDTAADFVFFVAVTIKLISALWFPNWLFIWICVIFAVKVADLVIGFVRHRQFVAVHSAINRICGVVVFIPPLFIGGGYAWQVKAILMIFACLLASAAAVDESIKVLTGRAVE